MPKDVAVRRRTPPRRVTAGWQYDPFTTFLGDSRELSNTIELRDAIPK